MHTKIHKPTVTWISTWYMQQETNQHDYSNTSFSNSMNQLKQQSCLTIHNYVVTISLVTVKRNIIHTICRSPRSRRSGQYCIGNL